MADKSEWICLAVFPTWDLLKSSPDCEEYVPMKYGVFFSDPEVQQEEEEVVRVQIPEEFHHPIIHTNLCTAVCVNYLHSTCRVA